MKKAVKLTLALFIVFAFVSVSFSEGLVRKNFGNCGLGTKFFGDKDGLLMHSLAATTNGYTGTFGVTTGTSGCEQFRGIVFDSKKVEKYVASNMDNLANDIARGQGEYLETLAVIMEIDENNRTAFYLKLQNNFDSIYTSDDVTAQDVVKNLDAVLRV